MSFNRWLVGVQGEQLHIQNPQSRLDGRAITHRGRSKIEWTRRLKCVVMS